MTEEPAGIFTPDSSVSRVATRVIDSRDHEDGFTFLAGHHREVQPLNGFLAAHPRQFGVGVANVTGDCVVECPEVVEIVEKFHFPLPSSWAFGEGRDIGPRYLCAQHESDSYFCLIRCCDGLSP
jgi:hypothetical protein